MNKWMFAVLPLLFAVLPFFAVTANAEVPPPTRQDLGLFDAVFDDFDEQDFRTCSTCHGGHRQ